MKTNTLLLLFLLFVLIVGCKNSSTEPEDSKKNYMIINDGDIRQYFFEMDSSYMNWEFKGKVKRPDGINCNVGLWSLMFFDEIYIDTSYYFIKDGYFIATKVKPNIDNKENLFEEQKLMKLEPKEGDSWVQINGDEESPIITVNFINEKITNLKKFVDLYKTSLHNQDLTTFYAKGYGHIGTDMGFGMETLVSYMKINGEELGKYNQLKKTSSKKVNLSLKTKLNEYRLKLIGQTN